MEQSGSNRQNRTEWEQGGLNKTEVDQIEHSGPM